MVKKSKIIRLLAAAFAVSFLFSSFSMAVSAAKTDSVPKLVDPYIKPTLTASGYYVGVCNDYLSDSSSYYLEFDVGGGTSSISVKKLFGDPSPSDNEPGKTLIPYQSWDDDTIILKKSWMKECSGCWLKIYVNANEKSCHFYIRVSGKTLTPPVPTVDSIGSATSLKVTWNAVSGAAKYEIARSLSKKTGYKTIAVVSGTTWSDSGLQPDTKYYYSVNAISSSGKESGFGTYDYNWTEEKKTPVISENARRMVDIARNEIGYCETQSVEKVGNKTVTKTDITKFGKYTGTDGYSWCASFIAWCAKQAGLSGSEKPFKCGTYANPRSLLNGGTGWYFYDAFNVKGKVWTSQSAAVGKKWDYFIENLSSSYDPNRTCQPQAGDLIFFMKSDGSPWAHVGLVTNFDSDCSLVTYVDGNGSYEDNNAVLLSGKPGHVCVSEWTIPLDASTIMAIVRPDYK